MPERMDRSTLLVRMQEAHADLEAALAAAPVGRLTEPDVTGEWSVRDLLNHIAFWEQQALRRLSLAPAGQPSLPSDEAEMHRVNAESVAAGRGRSPAEALAAHHQAYAELLATVSALGDDELNDTARFGDGEAVWQKIAGDSYEHYEEHAGEIRAWLDRTAAGSISAR